MGKYDHFDFEEEFHSQDRKASRKERRLATQSDRSKYKKSDQDQLKKLSKNNEIPTEGAEKGRVVMLLPQEVIVSSGEHYYRCSLKGVLKKEKSLEKNLIVVGDLVSFVLHGEKEGTIVAIHERYSVLSRAHSLSQKKEQLIAVNIDQVMITTSVVSPPIKPTLIDRYLIAARKGNMVPIIVINKIDLLTEETPVEKEILEMMLEAYRKIDVPVLLVSSATGRGIEELKEYMKGSSSVFSGQSGVGKSSLINAVTQGDLPVGDIVDRTQKGSHTTTTAHLLPVEGGGFCIDTPGIRSFGVWELKKEEIPLYFPEIREIAVRCKYDNCTHQLEPECAVKEAVEKGRISPLRFDSYCALMESVASQHINR